MYSPCSTFRKRLSIYPVLVNPLVHTILNSQQFFLDHRFIVLYSVPTEFLVMVDVHGVHTDNCGLK